MDIWGKISRQREQPKQMPCGRVRQNSMAGKEVWPERKEGTAASNEVPDITGGQGMEGLLGRDKDLAL